jgi:hypothetical protein
LGEADGLPRIEDDGDRVIGRGGLGEPDFDVADLDRVFGCAGPGVDPVEDDGVFVEVQITAAVRSAFNPPLTFVPAIFGGHERHTDPHADGSPVSGFPRSFGCRALSRS